MYCGRCLRNAERGRKGKRGALTLDHVTPRALWGTNAATNVVTCCATCNESKGMRTVREAFGDDAAVRVRNATRRRIEGYRITARAILASVATWHDAVTNGGRA